MANTKFCTANSLETKALQYQLDQIPDAVKHCNNKRLMTLIIGGFIGVLCIPIYYQYPLSLPLAVILLLVAGISVPVEIQAHPILEAGATGESLALESLKRLDDRFTVFNQVKLPYPQSRTGYLEADFVVCGPNGIFVIENKHYRGEIRGKAEDDQLEQRVYYADEEYNSMQVRNPVKQVKHYVSLVKAHLKKHGIYSEVTGIVSLSHPDCENFIVSRDIDVIGFGQLAGYVNRFRGLVPDPNALDVLVGLAKGNNKTQTPTFSPREREEKKMTDDDKLIRKVVKVSLSIVVFVIGMGVAAFFYREYLLFALVAVGAVITLIGCYGNTPPPKVVVTNTTSHMTTNSDDHLYNFVMGDEDPVCINPANIGRPADFNHL